MLIQTRERQKNMIKKLSQVKLQTLLTIPYKHPVLLSLEGYYFILLTSPPSPSILLYGSVSKEVSFIFSLFLFDLSYAKQALSLFLKNLSPMAPTTKQKKTMIQVNWLAKKFAVLYNNLYLPQIFCPSVLLIRSSLCIINRDPEVIASKVKELILNLQRLVRKISNCWGKYKLMKTIRDIYWASSIVLTKKCLCPVRRALTTAKSSANAKNTAIMDLLLQLNSLLTVQIPDASSSVQFVQQHMPAIGLNVLDAPLLSGQVRH